MKYQVVAREKLLKDIGGGRQSTKEVDVPVGDAEKYRSDAETFAKTLQEMFRKMGRIGVDVVVVPVE